METTKTDLLKILSAVRPGLAKKEVVEQMGRFIFTGENVATFNDKICIHYPFEFEVPFSVKATDFYNTVSALDSEKVDMRIKGNNVVIDTERSKGMFSTKVQDDIGEVLKSIINEIEECEWYNVPEDFIKAIDLVKFSASSDNTSTWSCVRFDGANVFCGADHRFSWYKFDESLVDVPFMIKAVNIDAISPFDIKAFAISDSWAHFATENEVIFSARLTKGEYTDPKRPFSSPKGQEIKLPDTILEDVEFVAIIQSEDMEMERTIKMIIEDGKITYQAEKERGRIERTSDTDIKVDDKIVIGINPVFLKQILTKSEGLRVYFGDQLFRFESDKFKHIIALKNIEGEEVE